MTVDEPYISRIRTGETAAAAAALAFGLSVFSSPDYGQTVTIPDTDSSAIAQASSVRRAAADDRSMVFETLTVRKEDAVLFGHVAVKERVNAIALAPAEDFRRDSDLFGEGVRNPEAQNRIKAAIERGFQSRDAEMDLARMLGDLPDH